MADNAQPILWRKRHNLTAWIFQILSAIVYGGFSIYRLMVIISYNENIQSSFSSYYARHSYMIVTEAIMIAAMTFAFVIVEIVFYAQSKLDLSLMLVLTSIKVTVWGIHTVAYAAAGSTISFELPAFVAAPAMSVVLATAISQLVITCVFVKQQKARGAYSGVPKNEV